MSQEQQIAGPRSPYACRGRATTPLQVICPLLDYLRPATYTADERHYVMISSSQALSENIQHAAVNESIKYK